MDKCLLQHTLIKQSTYSHTKVSPKIAFYFILLQFSALCSCSYFVNQWLELERTVRGSSLFVTNLPFLINNESELNTETTKTITRTPLRNQAVSSWQVGYTALSKPFVDWLLCSLHNVWTQWQNQSIWRVVIGVFGKLCEITHLSFLWS